VVARIVLWDLAESGTTIEDLRERLPGLPADDRWIWNSAQERFGLISFTAEPPDVSALVALIGAEPALVEEFDSE
jgi:hypothetical protein